MNIDKVIDVLETNLKVGTGNLRVEHKPSAYQIAEATRQALTELKKIRLGRVSNLLPLTQREGYLKGWEDGVEYAKNIIINDC